MSFAILELDLREPAASVDRINTPAGLMWQMRCERCARHSKPYHLLSNACRAHELHCDDHATRDEADLTALLSTVRKPLEVLAVAS